MDTTDDGLAESYLMTAAALVPEAKRLRTMYRERFRAAQESAEPDWGHVLTASRATSEVCASIINMACLALRAGIPLERCKNLTIPSPDGDLLIAGFEDDIIVLTADGEPMLQRWHGEDLGETSEEESVRYERWTSDRKRYSHGYLDKVSRAIVQTG